MKINYSQYPNLMKKMMKDCGFDFTERDYNSFVEQALEDMDIPEEKDRYLREFRCFYSYYFKKAVKHYYINSVELCKFLDSSVRNPSLMELQNLLPEDEKCPVIAIHFPNEYSNKSLIVNPAPKIDESGNKIGYCCFAYDSENSWLMNEKNLGEYKSDFDTDYKRKIANFILGFAYYKHCFPEAIKYGFPENGKHPNHYREFNNITLSAVSDVIDNKKGVTPHFRNGYFRFLQAECFTKKRFQTVFVSETFVKGKALTVTDED